MALTLTSLRKPINRQVVDPSTGIIREDWALYLNQIADHLNAATAELSSASGAPADGEYIVGSASSGLSAERVATDTATVDYDGGTAGQAKWNVLEVPGIGSTGLVARTAAATYAARTLTGPAAGITVSNGNGVSGNPTLSLADDLAALEAMSGTGIIARTASNIYAQRTITGGAGVAVSNGDGVSGNPTVAVTTPITQGTATINFGAFPGASDTSVAVTGQTGIVADSLVRAWIRPVATADHSADEHWVETLDVMAGNIVAGTGFTIYGKNTSTVFDPKGGGTRLYGQFNVNWQWS